MEKLLQSKLIWGLLFFSYQIAFSQGFEDKRALIIKTNPTPGKTERIIVQKNKSAQFLIKPVIDGDSSSLFYSLETPPLNGVLSSCLEANSDLSCEYTPNPNFYGKDFFTYRVSNNEGDDAIGRVDLVVNAPPVALFSSSTFIGEAPLEVEFDAIESYDPDGIIASYRWDFGDGEFTYGVNVGHTYQNPGTYTVTLTLKDLLGGVSTLSKKVTVTPANQAPVANFRASAYSGTSPLKVNFDASLSSDIDGIIVSYKWSFGDGSTDTGITTSYVFTELRSYKIILTVTDDQGASSQKELYIDVQNLACNGEPTGFHPNGGGYVARTATVERGVFLGPLAQVCDKAQVLGIGKMKGRVVIKDKALIFDAVSITGPEREKKGELVVSGEAQIFDRARLEGTPHIFGKAKIKGSSFIHGSTKVFDEAIIDDGDIGGKAKIYGRALIQGRRVNLITQKEEFSRLVKIFDEAQVFGDAKVIGQSQIFGQSKIYGASEVIDSIVSGQAEVFEYSSVRASDLHSSSVFENAKIYGNAQIIGSLVYGNAQVRGVSSIEGIGEFLSEVFGKAIVEDEVLILNSRVFDRARVFERARIENFSNIYGSAQVNYDVSNGDVSN